MDVPAFASTSAVEEAPLPVAKILPALLDAVAAGPNAVLVAPPGAGKTSLVPLALLRAQSGTGRILVTEPRRLAARAAASRMAALLGEQVGQGVGFRTRFESAVGPQTRIEVVTEGILLRRLQSDPGLEDVSAVVLDEVHERSVNADLAIALLHDVQRGFRPELRLIAMSATADSARLAALLEAPVLESEGRVFPIEIRHGRDIQLRDLPEAMARAVEQVLQQCTGDVLAFLPGMAEIRRTSVLLAGCGAEVLALHGDLPPEAQERALRPGGARRVVLATSIAETSLTLPGIRIVVDGGFRRAPRFDPGAGFSRLETVRISRAAATQRAGRAGREAPGFVHRLWSETTHRGLAAFDRPEILDADLSPLVLACAAWGAAPASLGFIDLPPAGALASAQALLETLAAVDKDGRITPAGRTMMTIGAQPRLAAMIALGIEQGEAARACALAALLEEGDPLRGAGADIMLRLEAMSGRRAADHATLGRIRRAEAQYRRRAGVPRSASEDGNVGALLAAGFPDRVAQARGGGVFRMSGGGTARLDATDSLARAPMLVVALLDGKAGAGATIRLAAPLSAESLPKPIAAQIVEQREAGFDAASGSVFSRARRRLGALLLEDRIVEATAEERAAILAKAAGERLATLGWSERARQIQARVAFWRSLGEEAPDLSDPVLAASAEEWLAPHCSGFSRLDEVRKLDLAAVLLALLPWPTRQAIDVGLPEHIALPRGRRAAIDYTAAVPLASSRAQDFYGLRETPKLAGGRIPLRLALLSPAGRPVAVTADLERFWLTGWPEVRREMRGRYPKHDWPERP